MECRKFQIAILSAQGLENVREIFRMKVYAQLSIPGNPQIKRETPVDTEGETNPAWNSTIRFTIGNQAVEHQGVVFVIKLYCSRALGDRYIGEVSLSFKDLFDGAAPTSQGRSSGIWVKKPSRFLPRNLAAAGFFIMKVVLEATLEQASISTFHSLEKMFRYVNEHDKYIELKS
ncbi:protein SRC2-like [Vitis vinifera]|uniref:protein SRC2-like n=1 Tax=Vitis vinifera TaxID=29760 RepID=UPI00053F9CA9|nr:protein SRC2-like [Vitis vinifera]|eukprot:XP_010662790.1 PREDICTED: protein SRC2-like [Vitis vinifera]